MHKHSKYSKPAKIIRAFGRKDGYLKAVREPEDEIYPDTARQLDSAGAYGKIVKDSKRNQ